MESFNFAYNITLVQKKYMSSNRQNKVGKLIQKDLSDIFLHMSRELFKNTMVTITVVRVTADLGIARVYLSIFPSGKSEEVLNNIKLHSPTVRLELGKKIRHQLKTVPELEFYIDDSLDYIENIDRILKDK
jgi:ribosome-binding factor A